VQSSTVIVILNPKLVTDEADVGRPVGINSTSLAYPHRITITAGLEATNHGKSMHFPKGAAVNVEARLYAGELRFMTEAHDSAALKEELRDFKGRLRRPAGRHVRLVGAHDDLVLNVAIATWMAMQAPTALPAGVTD